MRSIAAILATVVGLLLPRAVAVQTPARDPTVATPSGTGTITGVVIADDGSNRPVRQAKVTASSAAMRRQLYALTDESGRFVFRQLAAGRYSIAASRPGYLPSSAGAKKPGGPGVPLVIGDGEQAQ